MPNPTADARFAANTGQEGPQRPTVVPPPVAANPEVSDRPHRRTFTAQEKLSILKEADRATGAGAIGAILRRHGLYSSALSEWRRQRDAGTLGALTPARRGPKPSEANPLTADLAGALRENAQLKRRLERAEGIIAVQKKIGGFARDAAGADRARQHALTAALAADLPLRGALSDTCAALGLSRASLARSCRRLNRAPPARHRPSPKRALSAGLRQNVLDLLRSPRFADLAPAEVYATLLDEGIYLCSISTMYRILNASSEVRERRRQLRHPAYSKPELLAVRPNEVWSWDITKLKGPAKWTYFYLYVIIDIFSRRVVGWCVADAENAFLFKALFNDTVAKHNVPAGQLTLHADRGGPMKAKATAFLLADLGVTKSHSRPHTANDNPFSESHFKTLKYQPSFPACFGCIEDAKQFCRLFFGWYNQAHHHTSLGLMTPDQVHYGQANDIHAARQIILDRAFSDYPERFVNKPPTPPNGPTAVWINPPLKQASRASLN